MKKIIIPVDFSKHSEYALETGAALAKKHNAELTVMHMLELSESVVSKSDSEKDEELAFMFALANKRFTTFLDKPYLQGITVNRLLKFHKVLKEVSEVALDIDADLIIMGSRGHSDHDGIFTGSNTEKVVRYSKIPVLVLKSKPQFTTFNNAVLATDFSLESIETVKRSIATLNVLSTKTTLLYVNLPNVTFKSTTEIDDMIKVFLKTSNLNFTPNIDVVSDYNVEDGIINYAKKHDADLLAMVTRGKTGLSHFFGGSISEDVVNHSILPVLTNKI